MSDAHIVIHDHDGPDRRCWATNTVGYADCGMLATSDVGLCDKHLDELRDGQRRADAPSEVDVEWIELEVDLQAIQDEFNRLAAAMPAGRARITVIVGGELADREGGV